MHDLQWLTVIFHSLKLFLPSEQKTQKTRIQLYCTGQKILNAPVLQLTFCSVPLAFFFTYWENKTQQKPTKNPQQKPKSQWAANYIYLKTPNPLHAIWQVQQPQARQQEPDHAHEHNPLLPTQTAGSATHQAVPKAKQDSATCSRQGSAHRDCLQTKKPSLQGPAGRAPLPSREPPSCRQRGRIQPPVTETDRLNTAR